MEPTSRDGLAGCPPASLGLGAAGLAHDLSNLLTPILPTLHQLRARIADPESLMLLERIESSARAAAELLRKSERCELSPLPIAEFLADFERLLIPLLPREVELAIHRPQGLSSAMADARLLRRVLLNLCLNARDAMPEGGRLEITATQQGDCVCISVRDTGQGMPAEVAARAFEPCYSTKAQGAGLGLSIVKELMEKQAGSAQLESVPGHGTVVRLTLPTPSSP